MWCLWAMHPACGVDHALGYPFNDLKNTLKPLSCPHKIQVGFLERGLRTVCPAPGLPTLSRVSLIHPLDLGVRFME